MLLSTTYREAEKLFTINIEVYDDPHSSMILLQLLVTSSEDLYETKSIITLYVVF